MEHIVQLGIGIDDNVIRERIMKGAEKQIMDELVYDTKCAIFKTEYQWGGTRKVTSEPNDWFASRIEAVLLENKDAIIEAAAEKLADKISRTKKFKEVVAEVLE
jgi:hypothetical protein